MSNNLPAAPTSFATPTLAQSIDEIYEFVTAKAHSVGTSIPRNRGVPATATEDSMLSQEEKAVLILGRAIGASYDELELKINEYRAQQMRNPSPTGYAAAYRNMMFKKKYRRIMKAVQLDILESMELFSPLVSGVRRFIWRAQMLEYLRRKHADAIRDGRTREALNLDKTLRSHMAWFDTVGVSGDIGKWMTSPADEFAKQGDEIAAKEAEIEQQHKDGRIDDLERLRLLRAVRHGK